MRDRRVFLIVLDSYGIGNGPDAEKFGDLGSNTLRTISKSKEYHTPNMNKIGLFNIDGIDYGEKEWKPIGAYGRLQEASKGKDTTIGHWEIAGIVSHNPLPTFPEGFPKELLDAFSKATGRGILCNKPYSGTDVIRDYGEEHVKTGDLIVYTSVDSVFQIAAHEEVIPIEQLYQYCEFAREMLTGEWGVGRVIARPFTGVAPHYQRTSNRHDFSLLPPKPTMLDCLQEAGYDTYGIGKIYDIFAGQGIAHTMRIQNNEEGMRRTIEMLDKDFRGICFVNLVDFDMMYGHRNDIDGYAKAATAFDKQLKIFMEGMKDNDILMITADHGCDPGYKGTDHSRECIPLLAYGKEVQAGSSIGTRNTFADIGATVLDLFDLPNQTDGTSFASSLLIKERELVRKAYEAQQFAYTPYSHWQVGAALLGKSGKIYLGCNIENAAYSPTNCGERTAFFKAISEGEKEFEAIAIVGNKEGQEGEGGYCPPCGVCRQVMMEFCNPQEFKIILGNGLDDYKVVTLKEMLPMGFGGNEIENV